MTQAIAGKLQHLDPSCRDHGAVRAFRLLRCLADVQHLSAIKARSFQVSSRLPSTVSTSSCRTLPPFSVPLSLTSGSESSRPLSSLPCCTLLALFCSPSPLQTSRSTVALVSLASAFRCLPSSASVLVASSPTCRRSWLSRSRSATSPPRPWCLRGQQADC
ncbi:hypothetical protein DL89DRAFT_15309 [Linderina pennispora]|uniref:Uncharacterized protein n=1 Tax=Linderina pennispora TaxID=61395 RepID=A0A1Y1WLE3_9FUNG|nr:uncharacterized protein DL89DRAFT_15309 [Linderina pennispora]ORX74389.1 hypothetical protein DL89DRAFT_15309 [Linderina pennispora]